MTEPDVTLTDYALAVECAVFALLAYRWPAGDGGGPMRRWWVTFFISIGVGSLVGGTVHGFFLEAGFAHDVLWRSALLSLGLTSLTMWMIGAGLYLAEPSATWVRRAAVAQVIAYTAIVLFVDSRFVVAIATYVPATVFLLIVEILTYRRVPNRQLAYGIAGLLLTFVAAAVQQLGVGIHPVYFNHNALYHVLQGIALFLIFLGANWIVTSPSAKRSIA